MRSYWWHLFCSSVPYPFSEEKENIAVDALIDHQCTSVEGCQECLIAKGRECRYLRKVLLVLTLEGQTPHGLMGFRTSMPGLWDSDVVGISGSDLLDIPCLSGRG
jgi:hypothetical protein